MNCFVEGLQGSGKSTLVRKLAERNPGHIAVREGEYSPVELSWCAWVEDDQYQGILEKYPDLRPQIEEQTFSEGCRKVICYTKVVTENRSFYQDLEQYEIYNNRIPLDEFQSVVLTRYKAWNSDSMIFECSLFQNIVEDMILFREASDEEILSFYRRIREALAGKEYRIVYLKAEDIRGNLAAIRKERSDAQGNEVWFPMMMGFFCDSPYGRSRGLKGEEDLIRHFMHRQNLELRICREVFPERSVVIASKNYSEEELTSLLSR